MAGVQLDRIITYTVDELETVAAWPVGTNWTIPYVYGDFSDEGEFYLQNSSRRRINNPALGASARKLGMNIEPGGGAVLPSKFPTNHIEVLITAADGWRYTVTEADHNGRDGFNQGVILPDVWFLTLTDPQILGTGFAAANSLLTNSFNLNGLQVAGDGVTVTETDKQYKLWAHRRDPRPSDRLELLATGAGRSAVFYLDLAECFWHSPARRGRFFCR